MTRKYKPGWFEEVETDLRQRVMELERDLTREIMEGHDVDAGAIEIAGKEHRRVLRASQTYVTQAGPVVVERWLYRDREDDTTSSVSPMELRLGLVGEFWTPAAAKTALWVVAQMTPQKAEELFKRTGGMTPSKSSLDRLPKLVSDEWERDREAYEAALRAALVIPEGTVSVAVSLDGVLAPIDGGASPVEVRNAAANEGFTSKGPAGYREVGCATLSFCDAKGDLLGAIRMARTPEAKKRTLKASLEAELIVVLRQMPALKIVKVADGVDDNWTFCRTSCPPARRRSTFSMQASTCMPPSRPRTATARATRGTASKTCVTCSATNVMGSSASSEPSTISASDTLTATPCAGAPRTSASTVLACATPSSSRRACRSARGSSRRLAGPGRTAAQAERHALGARRTGDLDRSRVGSKRPLR